MGVSGLSFDGGSSSTYDEPRPKRKSSKLLNPDPKNFRILKGEQIGDYLIVLIHYPDCTNYEGKKICLYKGVTLSELAKREDLDPHFTNNKNVPAPLARFVPTDAGWKMARKLCECM